MPEWIIAMFLIGALLSAGDMAKIFLEARRSRREAAVYDNHPQKLQLLLLFNLAVQTGKTGCICIDLLLKADSLYGKDCNQAAQDYGN